MTSQEKRMADAKEVKFSLKVMINKQKTKVLFAEVDSNFADVLLSFLTLPLGTIVSVLKKHYGDETPAIGSLTTLYNGLANLGSDHFLSEVHKLMILNPISSFHAECCKLKLDISDTQSTNYFACENSSCHYPKESNISINCATTKCRCGKMMSKECMKESPASIGGRGVFTINKVSFLISDDLRMLPNLAGPIKQTLRNLGITDMDGAELRNVTFGFNEIMCLLKGSLLSQTPLSDLIFNKRQIESAPGNLFHEKERKTFFNSEKMALKVTVECSINKVLFAQSDEDFIDFLCTLLVIPLGVVESLLGGNTSLKSIDNLYKSILNLIDHKYFTSPDIKDRLMKPNLLSGYISQNMVLPLSGQSVLYYGQDSQDNPWLTYSGWPAFMNGVKGNYAERPNMCMVTDDLTVIPSNMISILSSLNDLNIPLSNVKEVEMQIGLQEALSILKASLTSKTALTDGLKINSMLNKQLNEELFNSVFKGRTKA